MQIKALLDCETVLAGTPAPIHLAVRNLHPNDRIGAYAFDDETGYHARSRKNQVYGSRSYRRMSSREHWSGDPEPAPGFLRRKDPADGNGDPERGETGEPGSA